MRGPTPGAVGPCAAISRTVLRVVATSLAGSLFLLVVGIVPNAWSDPKPKQPNWVNQADRLERAGKTEDAIKEFRKILAESPTSDEAREARVRLGSVLLRLNRNDAAITEFHQALDDEESRTKPSRSNINKARKGIFYGLLQKGEFDNALEHVRTYLKASGLPEDQVQAEVARKAKIVEKWKSEAPAKAEIRELIRKYAEAISQRDFSAFEAILAEEYPAEKRGKVQAAFKEGNVPKLNIERLEITIRNQGRRAKARGEMPAAKGNPARHFFFELRKAGTGWKIASD